MKITRILTRFTVAAAAMASVVVVMAAPAPAAQARGGTTEVIPPATSHVTAMTLVGHGPCAGGVFPPR